jgi:hypothetical protein
MTNPYGGEQPEHGSDDPEYDSHLENLLRILQEYLQANNPVMAYQKFFALKRYLVKRELIAPWHGFGSIDSFDAQSKIEKYETALDQIYDISISALIHGDGKGFREISNIIDIAMPDEDDL